MPQVPKHAFPVGSEALKKYCQRKKQANGKLNARFLRPCTITENHGKGLYALELVADPTQKVSRVHGAHLKLLVTCLHLRAHQWMNIVVKQPQVQLQMLHWSNSQ